MLERICFALRRFVRNVVLALRYDVPDDVTYVFFNNPVEGEVFAHVVDSVVASIRRRPQTLKIVHYAPTQEETPLRAGARLLEVAGASWPYKGPDDSPPVKLNALDERALATESSNAR